MSDLVTVWICETCGSVVRLGRFVVSTGDDINVQVTRCLARGCGGRMVCAIAGVAGVGDEKETKI